MLYQVCLSSLALSARLLSPRIATSGSVRAASGVRMALVTDESKALHAVGYNIGMQLGDLKGFSEDEVENVLSGLRAALLEEPPEVPLSEYVPRASQLIENRKAAAAEKMAEAGKATLAEITQPSPWPIPSASPSPSPSAAASPSPSAAASPSPPTPLTTAHTTHTLTQAFLACRGARGPRALTVDC